MRKLIVTTILSGGLLILLSYTNCSGGGGGSSGSDSPVTHDPNAGEVLYTPRRCPDNPLEAVRRSYVWRSRSEVTHCIHLFWVVGVYR